MNLIFKTIVGSQAYGTSTPESDIDYKGVYISPLSEVIGFDYKHQITVNKDEMYYDIKRFIELLSQANPTALELLYSPNECIIEKSPVFDIIIKHRDKFLTKICYNSFVKYAESQINKANALDKKMNWETNRVTRKTPLDFCYVTVSDGKSYNLIGYLSLLNIKQENCGLVKLSNMNNLYALYHNKDIHYKGIIGDDSNELRLSSVPVGERPIATLYYNKDGYSMHCKDYMSYLKWLEDRNENRYIDVNNHGQKIDGKNMMHCVRLIQTAKDIVLNKNINVRVNNPEFLLSIKKGSLNLEQIKNNVLNDIKELKVLYEKSDLPENINNGFINNLLLEIYTEYYGICID